MALIDKLTNIANAIRDKNGKTDAMTLDQMVTEISNIQTGIDTSDANITANKMLVGYSGYANGVRVEGSMQPVDESEVEF